MKLTRIYLFFFFLVSLYFQAIGQHYIRVFDSQKNSEISAKPDTMFAIGEVHRNPFEYKEWILSYFHGFGYIEAAIDSLRGKDTLDVFMKKGIKYQWNSLTYSKLLDPVAKFYRWNLDSVSYVNVLQINILIEQSLVFYENHGYPFAKVFLKDFEMDSNLLSAVLDVEVGQQIFFDSLLIKGEVTVSTHFVEKLIGIEKGNYWNEELFHQIPSKVNSLEFATLAEMPVVSFYDNNASCKIVLKPRKSNSFDAVFGFYSNEQTGKLALTGNANLLLINSLGVGERFELKWQRPVAGSQMLDVKAVIPYLLKTNWGVNYSLSLFRQDSSFLNVANGFDLAYRISFNHYFALKLEQMSSQITLLERDSTQKSTSSLLYGLGYSFDSRDWKLNPTRGLLANFDLMAGNRNVKSFHDVAETNQIRTLKAQSKYQLEFFKNFYKRNVLVMMSSGGFIFSDGLVQNEKFRIGGLSSLRGFDEQSIFSSSYIIVDFEYRYLISSVGYFSVFYNHGFVNENDIPEFSFKNYAGFGLGGLLDTGSGIISVYLALGKSPETPINMNNTKVHFGYLIRF
ncbi:MAG: BamA/TamA family outer membrane protein [Bacteroidales bacterium]|nr:BamA/TamA family outer membrane protein [Bacteroidales bacterium]